MQRVSTIASMTAVIATLSTLAAAEPPVGSAFTYQGQLKRGGAPLSDTCEFTLQLFDADVGGSQIGSALVLANQNVVNGLIRLSLDFGPGRFDGNARWLGVSVQCTGDATPTTLSPRQPLTPAPNAMNADVLDGLDSSSFLQSIPNPLTLGGSQAGVPIIQGANSSSAGDATGVLGDATAISGSTFGVWGRTASSGGIGVLGQHSSNSGTAAGVSGESSSGAGGATGVYGKANGLSAVNHGVFGESVSTAGRGLYGRATAASGATYGVYGENVSAGGAGVLGFSTLGDGVSARSDGSGKAAVSAQTTNANGWAVLARHTSLAGMHPAVQGETASGSVGAKGVYGLATSASAATYGVYGEAASASGQGVYGVATSSTGATYGVQGETRSATNGAAGVAGYANGDSGKTYGLYGQADSNGGYAVYGNHPGSGRGVYGASAAGVGVYATTGTGGNALYAERTANGNKGWIGGINEGIWGESNNNSAIVGKTANGTTAIYGERLANGNQGWLGGLGEGVAGQANAGNGVSGVTTDAASYGGYFRNDGGGAALFADGLARVRTLEILDGGDLAEPFEVRGGDAPVRTRRASDGPGRDDSTRAASGSERTPRGPEGTEGHRHEDTQVTAGMVVVIDAANPGALELSTQPYDRKVAGVVSGAKGLSAGMVMKAKPHATREGARNVALAGRVWCWCDATPDGGSGPIEPGDLLTTSGTPGHAMRATDFTAAQGAVIGKAMTPLPSGRGLVLVLVNLQ